MANNFRSFNLEQGMPTVQMAMNTMENQIIASKRMGIAVLKFIHGYGSSGKGGKIRLSLRQELEKRKKKGEFTAVIYGEKFSIFDEDTRKALTKCPALRNDTDLDRYNNGVTFIVF